MAKDMEQLYAERLNRYVTAMRNEKPDKIPIRPFVAEDAESLRQAEVEEEILELQRLGQQIAAAWVSPKSAVDLVDEQRR